MHCFFYILLLLWTPSAKAYGPCLQRCQGQFELCHQVAQSFDDLYTCKIAFQNCRNACSSDFASHKALSVAHTGEVAEKKRMIGLFGGRRPRIAILENIVDELDD